MNKSNRVKIVSVVAVTAVVVYVIASRSMGQSRNPNAVLRTVLKVAGIVSASKLVEESTDALNEHWERTAPPGESIYSVSFSFDRGSWADFWSKPDVFLVVEYEGGDKILVPDIENNWDYSPKIYTFRCPTFPEGSKCVLRLHDDDSGSDQVWKNILSTSVKWDVSLDSGVSADTVFLPLHGTAYLKADVGASGEFQLLTPDEAETITLDAPDLIAFAEFKSPKSERSDRWEMEGVFQKSGDVMGDVRLTHWYTNPVPVAARSFVRPRLFFWGSLTLGIAGLVCWMVYRSRKAESKGAEPAPHSENGPDALDRDCPKPARMSR